MNVEHEIVKKIKNPKTMLKASIDLYAFASELWEELENKGYIAHLQAIPQLGNIKVKKYLRKTRYDYVLLQLYLHQIAKTHLKTELEYSYSNVIKEKEFANKQLQQLSGKWPTIGDLLQVLVIAYNLGHFSNTFTASRAAVMLANSNETFRNNYIASFVSENCRIFAKKIIEMQNYHRFHLLNCKLILESCDQTKASIALAQNLIIEYLRSGFDEQISDKLFYVFDVFKRIRNISFVAYDLPVAAVPLVIDLCDNKALLMLLREILSNYNDRLPINSLFSSLSKLLDDTVYNENSHAIIFYSISRQIAHSQLERVGDNGNFLVDNLISQNSIFNQRYSEKKDFDINNILKLTFSIKGEIDTFSLLHTLEKMNFVKVGYYDRGSGQERTLVISISKKCNSKTDVSFKVLKKVVSAMQRSQKIVPSDVRYLLVVKFFLYYLLGERIIRINPTIDENICLFSCRGKHARVNELDKLLLLRNGNEDERHEADFIKQLLQADTINDTAMIICSSIITFDKNAMGKKHNEFDGMILFPNRKEHQVIFVESKNTREKPALAKKCLAQKLNSIPIIWDSDEICVQGHDCYFKYSLGI
jgi:hypothetical protein